MANFLETLSKREDKEFYLKQGFTYKIDIDASLLMLAANQQRDQTFEQTTHEEIISISSKQLNEVFKHENRLVFTTNLLFFFTLE